MTHADVMNPAPLSYVFLIFFITLGPLRVIPTFARITAGVTPADRRTLAWKGALIATGVLVAVVLICEGLRQNWHVSWGALAIATGLLLLISSLQVINSTFAIETHTAQPALHPTEAPAPKGWALSPVAIPGVVTPYGIAAVLLFLAAHPGDPQFRLSVIGLLLLVMLLDMLGMLFVRPVMRLITPAGFLVLGALFSILQAGLAIEIILAPLRRAFSV